MKRALILLICVMLTLCGTAFAEKLSVSISTRFLENCEIELTAVATGGAGGYSYKWYGVNEGTPIDIKEATDSSYIFNIDQLSDFNMYKATVTDNIETASVITTIDTNSINVSPSKLDFGERIVGYQNPPEPQRVIIANTYSGADDIELHVSIEDYTVKEDENENESKYFSLIKPDNRYDTLTRYGSLTFEVQPKANLPVGTHTAVIEVKWKNETNSIEKTERVDLTFKVNPQPLYPGISVSPTDVSFSSPREGYSEPPSAQTATIKNTGDLPIYPKEFAAYENFTVSAPKSWTDVLYVGETRSFTIQPKLGLVKGDYKETITVTTGESVTASVNAAFTVREAPVYDISLNPAADCAFPDAAETYYNLKPHVVTVTNIGNEPTGKLKIVLSGKNTPSFRLSKETIESIDVDSTISPSFSIEPVTGLKIGEYTATVTVFGENGIRKSFGVSFNVKQPWVNLSFTEQPASYIAIAPQDKYKQATIKAYAEADTGEEVYYKWYKCDISGKVIDNTVLGTEKSYDIPIDALDNPQNHNLHYYICRANCTGAQEVYSQVATIDIRKNKIVDSMHFVETRVMTVGESAYLPVQITPATISRDALIWVSSDKSIASVDSLTGLVTAIKTGTATIQVRLLDGKYGYPYIGNLSCRITVVNNVENEPGVGLRNICIDVNRKTNLDEIFGDRYSWQSLNNDIAFVSESDVLTGRGIGFTTVIGKLGTPNAKTALEGDVIELSVEVTQKGSSVNKITLSPKKPNIKRGESKTIKATVLPSSSSDKTLIWSSSDTDIAIVDAFGAVTGLKPGEATITAIASSGVTQSVSVKVSAAGTNPDKPSPQSIFFSSDAREQMVGENILLDLNVVPINADMTGLTWESGDTSIATVDNGGKVLAVSAGETEITAKIGELSAICRLTVKVDYQSVNVPEIDLDDLVIATGSSLNLNNHLGIDFGGNWTSSKPAIASVSKKGVLKGKKIGGSTLTFTVGASGEKSVLQGKSLVAGDTISINVMVSGKAEPGYKLEIKKDTPCYITPGEKYVADLLVTIGKAVISHSVDWKIDDSSIATVIDSGIVTGVKPGKTVLRAFDNYGNKDSMIITVSNSICEIGFDFNKLTLKVGSMQYPELGKWYPASLPKPDIVKWESNKPRVVSVDKNGMIKGESTGTAKITAYTESGVKTSFQVKVIKRTPPLLK